MKYFLLLLTLALVTSAQAQNTLVRYTFKNGTADDSGNGNDGILMGNAYVVDEVGGKLRIPLDSISHMIIPAGVLNGLVDFTIKFHVVFTNVHQGGQKRNHVLSGSSDECINCIGLGYVKDKNAWELNWNGAVYLFPDSTVIDGRGGQRYLRMIRESGLISLYNYNKLLGTAMDDSPINITSLLVGQRDHCKGGCFHVKECMEGFLDGIRVFDGPIPKESGGDDMNSAVSINLYPNPAKDMLTIYGDNDEIILSGFSIFNLMGEKIYDQPEVSFGETSTATIDVSRFAAGTYLLQINSGDGVIMKKFVVEK